MCVGLNHLAFAVDSVDALFSVDDQKVSFLPPRRRRRRGGSKTLITQHQKGTRMTIEVLHRVGRLTNVLSRPLTRLAHLQITRRAVGEGFRIIMLTHSSSSSSSSSRRQSKVDEGRERERTLASYCLNDQDDDDDELLWREGQCVYALWCYYALVNPCVAAAAVVVHARVRF